MTKLSNNAELEFRWKSMQEIMDMLRPSDELSNLATAVSLHKIILNSLHAENYTADPAWTRLVVPTRAGNSALEAAGLSTDSADAVMALFSDFYHHDIYIDCDSSDLDAITAIVHREIREGKLLIPDRFGRTLYDKFNDQYLDDRTDHLLPEESLALMSGTPQGVYQVGSLVTGPLGLILSPAKRYVPPSPSLPLWHCSDVGCGALHTVDLMHAESDLMKCIGQLQEAMADAHGPHSEWASALPRLLEPEISHDPFTYRDLGPLIADSIHGHERTALLALAMSGDTGARIRSAISMASGDDAASRGSAEAVCVRLSESEQLQLLYLLSDEELVHLVDAAVKRQLVKVPSSEIRTTKNRVLGYSPSSELSSLGLRCSGSTPLIDLCALIWAAYTSSDKLSELEWRLRSQTAGTSTRNALLVHLCQNDPTLAVQELILSSGDVTRYIAQAIGCPIDEATDAAFIDRVLWKLGFDIPRYSDPIKALRRRLEFFSQELLAVGTLSSEKDRERIRSAGVNLFVSIEEFLQELIRYNVWVLASDHFITTKFVYNSTSAMECVAASIGTTIASGGTEVRWSVNGENALGTLLAYLQATSHWMKGLLSADRSTLERDEADLPHYAEDRFRVFPLQHTALWADSDYNSLKRISDQFEAICNRVMRSQLAHIRNGLDHHRDESNFPKIDQMLAFVAQFREGLDSAEASLFYPKEHWVDCRTRDRYGRTSTTLLDDSGRQYRMYGPSLVHGTGLSVLTEHAILIAPGKPLGFANTELIFRARKPSAYSEYWSGYPRRRRIPSVHKIFARSSKLDTAPSD